MKTLRSLLCLLVVIISGTLVQGQVYNGNLYISNQAQADAFAFKVVDGNLQINGSITDFSGFDSLESVTGALSLFGNLDTVISGFNSLSTVEDLQFGGCFNLLKIEGFSSLDTVFETFKVNSNPELISISGFQNLKVIGRQFRIEQNNKLERIDSLHSLTSIGYWWNPTFSGSSFIINSGDSLTSISGFSSLSQIHANFALTTASPYLQDLDFLRNVTNIDGEIILSGLPGIKNLHDLDSLKSAGDITISLDGLSTFSGLTNLTTCRSISFKSNPSLTSINSGLNSLVHIGDSTLGQSSTANIGFRIQANPLLGSVDCLNNLKTVDSWFFVSDNPSLTKLAGFKNLQRVQGAMYIGFCQMLNEIPSFSRLDSVGGYLYIGHTSLQTISEFQNLIYIGGHFGISDNPQLFSVTGFENLISQILPTPGIRVVIRDNPLLLDLCGLYNFFQHYPNPNLYSYYLYPYYNPGLVQAIGNGECIPYDYSVSGSVFSDINGDCLADSTEPGLSQWIVKATGPTGTHYSSTDSFGQYHFWLDTAAYTLELISFPSIHPALEPYTSLCDSVKQIVVSSNPSLNSVSDWGASFPQCAYITTTIDNVIFRRCFSRNVLISYENLGYSAASQSVLVVRKQELLQIEGATSPFSYGVDSVLIFQLGNIPPGSKGFITLQVKVPCTTPQHLGLEQCLEVWVESPSFCQPSPSNWDGATLEARSTCTGDSMLVMEIRNYGNSPMTDSTSYRLFANTTLVQTGSIKLDTINSFQLNIPADNKTYRLEADQIMNHPYPGLVPTALEGCTSSLNGGTARGMITKFPSPRSRTHPSYTSICRPITGSYDPNDKQVFPTGVGPQELVQPGTELTYRIRFQNTGNDTAFTVRITDRLDAHLDQTTFSVVSTSHPYSVSFSGDSSTKVTFLFSNILLPDSNVNEPESHGYIEFKIKPKASIDSSTSISNMANIYFDFNPPIQTNKARTNFGVYTLPVLLTPKNPLLSNKAPEAPDLLTIQDSSQNFSILTWQDQAISESGFLVMRSKNDTLNFVVLDSLPVNSQRYLDTIPLPGSTFFYKVAAYSLGGLAYSNLDSIYTSYPIPPAPTILSFTDSTIFELTITWTDNTVYESGFIIQRSADSVNFLPVDSVAASTTTFTDSLPDLDQSFWYRVIAYNILGSSGPSDTIQVFQATPIPTAPSISYTDTSTLFAPIIGWTPSNYFETGYLIQRSTDSVTFSTLDSVDFSITSFQDSIHNLEMNYWYRVIAYNHQGNSPPSDTIRIFQLRPIPARPTNLTVDISVLFAPSLTWDIPDFFEEGFIIERSLDGQVFSTHDTIWGQVNTFDDTLQAVYIPIHYRVKAFNNSGTSAPSNTVVVNQVYPVPPAPDSLTIVSQVGIFPVLSWEDLSAYEEGFILERSDNNQGFVQIQQLNADEASTTDSSLLGNGTYQYRVLAYNQLGNSGYSNVVVHVLNTSVSHSLTRLPNLQVQPNPFTEYVIIKNEGSITQGRLLIINALGETVSVTTTNFPKELRVDMEELPVGTYFIQVILEEGSKSWKVQKH